MLSLQVVKRLSVFVHESSLGIFRLLIKRYTKTRSKRLQKAFIIFVAAVDSAVNNGLRKCNESISVEFPHALYLKDGGFLNRFSDDRSLREWLTRVISIRMKKILLLSDLAKKHPVISFLFFLRPKHHLLQ